MAYTYYTPNAPKERKHSVLRYKLRCPCGSSYVFNTQNPYAHYDSNKCVKYREENLPPPHKYYPNATRARCFEYEIKQNLRDGTAINILVNGFAQIIEQKYYSSGSIQGGDAKKQIVYDEKIEIMELNKRIRACNKIGEWFINIKYNPKYKYGKKYVNSLYSEIERFAYNLRLE